MTDAQEWLQFMDAERANKKTHNCPLCQGSGAGRTTDTNCWECEGSGVVSLKDCENIIKSYDLETCSDNYEIGADLYQEQDEPEDLGDREQRKQEQKEEDRK